VTVRIRRADSLLSKERIQSVEPGDFCKCSFTDDMDSERMWVKVSRIWADGTFDGTLYNCPCLLPMQHGQSIIFHDYEIIDIKKGPAQC